MTNAAAHDWRTCTVVESRSVSTRARRITLERPVASGRPAEPGTRIDVRIPLPDKGSDNVSDVRSYSIVESDDLGKHLTVTVQRAANSRGGSAYLHGLRVGDTIGATRPLQDFPLSFGADGYLLLAGGIGVTALVSVARALRRHGAPYRIVYAGRSRDDMAYLDLLREEHGERLTTFVDDEGSQLDAAALVAEVAAQSGRQELVMCGPVRLMDAVRRAWSAAELSPVDLRFETFGNSGWYDAEPFEVELPEQGITATVAADQTMLDALVEAGADLMWDCRKGECGLCAMAVSDLVGELDPRDVFFSERQQLAADRACMCVARVAAGGAGSGRVSVRTL